MEQRVLKSAIYSQMFNKSKRERERNKACNTLATFLLSVYCLPDNV